MADLTRAWTETQARLPDGWRLDSLRCASTGLDPAQRSDEWIAIAVNGAGAGVQFQAADPVDALTGLISAVASD